MHPFAYVMIATFIGTVVVLFSGIIQMTAPQSKRPSTKLMMLRVALSVLLLTEMLVYIVFIKH